MRISLPDVGMNPPTNENELMCTASALTGRALGDIAHQHGLIVPNDLKRAKGWVGELLEMALGASAGSRPVPDFEDIGVELKSIPLSYRHEPQESTFVSSAPLLNTVGLRCENSTVKAKLNRVLWVPVEAAHRIPLTERRIGRPFIWSPSVEDCTILQTDWEEHIERIALGDLDELGGRLGTYLQIRPKAINRHDRTNATNNIGEPMKALPRGFYLRTCFTRKILSLATR
jgi:DNA mismatch repair protein MutH